MTANNTTTFWQHAYQQYAPKLLGICRRYVKNIELAQDLVQDAFVTAIQKQDSFANKGSFEGWLRRITVNTVLMYLRKEKKLSELSDNQDFADDGDDNDIEDDNPKNLITNAYFEEKDLLGAIDQLPLHHKTVFNLYVFEKFSHQQIAETLTISIGTSKSHLARARKKLQEILRQKALTMKKEERKRAAIIPIFPSENDGNTYIDKIFEDGLENLQLAPKPLPTHLQQLMQETPTVNPPAPKAWFGASKPFFTILGSCIFGVGLVAYFLISSPNDKIEKSQNIDNQNITIQTQQNELKPILQENTTNQGSKSQEEQLDTNNIIKNSHQKQISKAKSISKSMDKNQENINSSDFSSSGNTISTTTNETNLPVEKQTVVVRKPVVKKDTVFTKGN